MSLVTSPEPLKRGGPGGLRERERDAGGGRRRRKEEEEEGGGGGRRRRRKEKEEEGGGGVYGNIPCPLLCG